MRETLFVALASVLAFVALSACGSKGNTTGNSTGSDNAFLDEVFADSTLDNIDFTDVGDAQLVYAGHLFCEDLGKRKGDGPLGPNDFSAVAEGQIATRFQGEVKNQDASPSGNGHVLLAYVVGMAAVHKFCPQWTDAL
jgi:hypothetical protein